MCILCKVNVLVCTLQSTCGILRDSFLFLHPDESTSCDFLHVKANCMTIDKCVFDDRVHDTAAIKAFVGSSSKLQLAEDDLLIANVSICGKS